MKTLRRTGLCLMVMLLAGCAASHPAPDGSFAAPTEPPVPPYRLACVGDSITFGSRIDDRPHNSYPAQLQRLLGSDWDVQNFGVSGATLLHAGDKPYIHEQAYVDALRFHPNVVVISLGTNDSKPRNWLHRDDFMRDYTSLIAAFRAASPRGKIFLCLPVPVVGKGNYGIREDVMAGDVDPQIRALAAEEDLPVIDLHRALDGKPDLLPDRVHPNAEGAGLMADAVYEAIMQRPAPAIPAAATSAP